MAIAFLGDSSSKADTPVFFPWVVFVQTVPPLFKTPNFS